MPRYEQEEPRIATVRQALDQLTVDKLKELLPYLPTIEKPTRKGDLIDLFEAHLLGDDLGELWNRLDETQQRAVSETIYSGSPTFNAAQFQAKYGELPVFKTKDDKWSHREKPSLLRLFLYGYDDYLPDDLKERLLPLVSKPEPVSLATVGDPPEFIERIEKEYEYENVQGSSRRELKNVRDVVLQIPVTRRDGERAARQDLLTLLRLIDKGKFAVSDKTHQASAAAMKEVTSLLCDGDFYPWQPKQDKWEQEIGPIKAFAWPLLVQAGKLAELHGKKLALTKAGRNALGAPPAETLKLLWQRWLKSKLLDEFNRVDEIKGQHSKSRPMTAVENRRVVINDALKQCPVGEWIKFDDFSRFMQAAGFEFVVANNPWELYLVDAQYGSLGNDGGWDILQARYLMAFLFEYTATLGLIDVAFIDPERARDDFSDQWGADNLYFLSRYDGLVFFRLNPLGAYCLELSDQYTPAEIAPRTSLTVLPSLQIITNGDFSPDEALLLETYAEKESDTVWHLSRDKSLAAVENGSQIKELREFLQARDEQPLPETAEGFIVTTERNARALKNKGTALLIECVDAELAELIATHERTKKLCLRAGERHLVVQVESEEQFRIAVRLLGYGMPRA